MTEKRTAPSARLLGPKGVGATRMAGAARPSDKRSSFTDADHLRTPKSSSPILRRSRSFDALVIQLSIDPDVRSIRYVDSLPAMGRRVKVEMLVAERDGQRFAYDLVHERQTRDLDSEGLLLLALEANNIHLVEVDREWINDEPRAHNCLMIWKNRSHPVDDSTRAAIVRALGKQGPVAIRKLGEIAGVSYPLKSVCALIWNGIVAVDLSDQLDLDAEVTVAGSIDRRRSVNAAPPPSNRGP
jgi:hypothetical protein